ncbi:MAG: hypothetical protein U9O24_04455 [Campylobacterota bacterium]|nr:hypothetical protein [Campylobacterota bacterium]
MKKLGLSIVTIVLVVGAYFFTAATAQVTEAIKAQVQSELSTLEKNGFTITKKQSSESAENFVLSFHDTDKITMYLNTKGIKVKKEDVAPFQGFKLGVNTSYLANSYSAFSLDLFPVALPKMMKEEMREDNVSIERVNKLIADKALLIHVDINKLFSTFKGYMKDINETFKGKKETVVVLCKDLKFSGEIEKGTVQNVYQRLKQFTVLSDKDINMKLTNLTSNYTLTGASKYDIETEYNIEKIEVYETALFTLLVNNINVKSNNTVSKDLLKTVMNTTVENAEFTMGKETQKMQNLAFDFEVNNLDITAFDMLQTINIEDEKAIDELSQQIISKGVTMSIPNFSVEKVTYATKTMDGFNMNASVAIDKKFDIKAASQDFLAILSAIESKAHISVSTDLFAYIAQEQRVMMFLMMMPPVDKAGKKVYDIEFSKGKLTVNGKAL